MKLYNGYYVTIGLEIHVALQTKNKLFSPTENIFSVNQFSLFDIGLPGVLPILNKEPVEMASAFALNVGASLERYSEFERKHYFYPDLPLGYQITQQNKPILIGGFVPIDVNGDKKLVSIEHAHLECDAAKSIHTMYNDYTAIDISRCASPLLEIVSNPCMHSPEEAVAYAKATHQLVTFLGICDGKLEEGSFRVDASISINKAADKLGTRVEIKNISSFNFLQSALNFEIERQIDLVESGGLVKMETRLYDEVNNETKSMRDKETVDEYRYLVDPDILPLYLDENLLTDVKNKYPQDYFQLKSGIIELFSDNGIQVADANINTVLSEYEICKALLTTKSTERLLKLVAFWLPEAKVGIKSTRLPQFSDLVKLSETTLSAADVKKTLVDWMTTDKTIEDCMPKFADNNEIEATVKSVLSKYPEQVAKYKAGEAKLIQFLIGKCMAELKGKASAPLVKSMVENLV